MYFPPIPQIKSPKNLLEFLGIPGPIETCRTFPLGFSAASSPWPTWNWTCLEPEELNGPQPPFFTLNSRLRNSRDTGGMVSVNPENPQIRVSVNRTKRSGYWQVVEFQRQLFLSFVLITFHQQTEELRFKDALQNAVVLLLVDDDEVVLQCAGGSEQQRDQSMFQF